VLITIDTLRADRVGAYGYTAARTPALDGLARAGARFDRAYAVAPITLPSHASIMTGRYPPGHGARHNGMRMDLRVATLAERFAYAGFATGAFVAAFPLDRRFGLIKGFQTYSDAMPRGPDGRAASERAGQGIVDEALQWLARHGNERFFLWVHLFEPHAPYGHPENPIDAQRPASARYDEDVAEADRQIGRLLEGLVQGPAEAGHYRDGRQDLGERRSTLIVAAADHGEAFGEHGEISHSLFTYDTTLRVPLLFAGAGVPGRGLIVHDAVSLIDIAPTIAAIMQIGSFDADGVNLSSALGGGRVSSRTLYAESFAPLLDFGWSPLRALRDGRWKYIAAPRPELYDIVSDPGETQNLMSSEPQRASELARKVDGISAAALPSSGPALDADALARLQALGYTSGRHSPASVPPDPKDRREEAARLAQITSGELRGARLEQALREILREDPENPQANVRLAYALVETNRCADAIPHFTRAIAHGLPTADAHLGLAGCQVAAKNLRAAERTLRAAESVEPGNPIVDANLGIVVSDAGHPADAIRYLQDALAVAPDLHQARFSLAVAYGRLGRRQDAAREATELLRRLPPAAPQRAEVERLLSAVR
jgi:arylsulfatase A-like enzyme/thioredoxin-like negative regulator of GroEL